MGRTLGITECPPGLLAGAVRDVLLALAQHNISVRTMGCLDDVEPHMSAMLTGAKPFGVPCFALMAYQVPPPYRRTSPPLLLSSNCLSM